MKGLLTKGLMVACLVTGLTAGNALAQPEYFDVSSDFAEFFLYDGDTEFATLEFGIYTVDDILNPDPTSFEKTPLFGAGTTVPATASVPDETYDPFGIYIYNTNNDKLWLSDVSLTNDWLGTPAYEYDNRSQSESFRLSITDVSAGGSDQWLIEFYTSNGAVVRLGAYGDDFKAIPEPTTMLLFGTGLAGLAGVARRRRK